MTYNRKDHFFKKAKKEGFAARSVYKLEEMDKRFKLLKPGQTILDLGCAPGSWSQYASRVVGPKGRIVGIDLQPVALTLPNAIFVTGDFLELDLAAKLTEVGITPPFDLVISDMAPNTTGVKFTDQARSHELCEMAFEAAKKYLKPGGHFVCKIFHGPDFEAFRKKLRANFDKVESPRPESTRTESKEIFFVCLSFRT